MSTFTRNCRKIEEWGRAQVDAMFKGLPAPILVLERSGISPIHQDQELASLSLSQACQSKALAEF
jgi:hypothetical protein